MKGNKKNVKEHLLREQTKLTFLQSILINQINCFLIIYFMLLFLVIFLHFKLLKYIHNFFSFLPVIINFEFLLIAFTLAGLLFFKKYNQINSLFFYRLIYYSLIFVLIELISYHLISIFGFSNTDPDSARYMVSSLIQSEASILAIVVTLSLVAVQQSASSYSPKVINLFKDIRTNPDFYIIILIYIGSIIYEVWLLKQLKQVSPTELNIYNILNFKNYIFFSSFEGHFQFSYSLFIFSLVALVIYISNTLDLLKPINIIKSIANNIKIEKMIDIDDSENYQRRKAYGVNDIKLDRDPIQPLSDIVNSSIMKYDYETARNGLNALEYQILYLFKDKKYKPKDYELSKKIFEPIMNSGTIALSIMDEQSTKYTIHVLHNITCEALGKKLHYTTRYGIKAIENIGTNATNKKMKNIIEYTSSSLALIGENLCESGNLEFMALLIELFKNIGMQTSNERLMTESEIIIEHLRKLSQKLSYQSYTYESTVRDLRREIDIAIEEISNNCSAS